MFVRDRIELLLDPGTPFLELSTLAANTEYGGEVPGAGIVSGIGIVNGREVVIHADDASVKGGAWYPLSVKKIVRTLDIAIENRLPVVHLCDSAGGFLPLQAESSPTGIWPGAFSAISRSFPNWASRKSRSYSVTARRAAPTCRH